LRGLLRQLQVQVQLRNQMVERVLGRVALLLHISTVGLGLEEE
jgi:hypothetical protein